MANIKLTVENKKILKMELLVDGSQRNNWMRLNICNQNKCNRKI